MDLSQFQFEEYGKVVLTPCFELVVTSTADVAVGAAAFEKVYAEFVRRWGAKFTTYSTGTMTSWRKVDSKALQMASQWLRSAHRTKNPDFSIDLHSGPTVTEMLPPAVRVNFENRSSYLSVHLAPEFAAKDAAPALEFAQATLGDDFPLATGWAGYAVLWNTRMGPLQGDSCVKLGAWVKRHPGLGHGDNFAIYERALRGVARVNWLTFLSPELTDRKGGTKAIAAALGKDIAVHELGRGVCIKAGPLPQIGDVNRHDDLPLYRRVGAFLKDIRTKEPPRFLDGLEDDATEEWFARFDS